MKSFHAADMRQALRAVRDALGADAVILDSRVVEGGVEVSAAVDDDEAGDPAPVRAFARPPDSRAATADGFAALLGEASAAADAPSASRLDAVSEEIRSLRGLLEERLGSIARTDHERRHPARAVVIRRFETLGLAHSLARSIADRIPEDASPARAWGRALEEFEGRIPVADDDLLTDGGVVALLGATGVGKTTTVAKLAARFALRHGPRQVALLTTDNYRVGAHEQLRSYARIMGVPVSVAHDADELAAALGSQYDRRLVLVDTAGMSQRDRRFSAQVKLLGDGSPLVRTYLVLPANSQRRSLEEAVRAFAGARPDACVITKVDESPSLGPALSVAAGHGIPVAYVSAGQRVPEDLAPARSSALLEQALAIEREPAGTAAPRVRGNPWIPAHAGG